MQCATIDDLRVLLIAVVRNCRFIALSSGCPWRPIRDPLRRFVLRSPSALAWLALMFRVDLTHHFEARDRVWQHGLDPSIWGRPSHHNMAPRPLHSVACLLVRCFICLITNSVSLQLASCLSRSRRRYFKRSRPWVGKIYEEQDQVQIL